jgi:hypothetical protein
VSEVNLRDVKKQRPMMIIINLNYEGSLCEEGSVVKGEKQAATTR